MAGVDAELRFPFINLEKAMSRAEQMFKADPQGRPMAALTVFEVWGYSGKSSGGFQTVGALKLYGLIDDSGAGADRRLFLTQAAKHYFLDEREDERRKALKAFALAPPTLASLWSVWNASPPADTIARSYLKLERSMNDQSARALLGIYKDNIAFADLKGSDKAPDLPQEPNEARKMADADTLEREKAGAAQPPPPPPAPPAPSASAPKVSLDGDQLTIVASIQISELPALLKKLKALEAFYRS